MIEVRISESIADEFIGRAPSHIPPELWKAGRHRVSQATARELLADALHNADPEAIEYMAKGTRAAYRALAQQLQALGVGPPSRPIKARPARARPAKAARRGKSAPVEWGVFAWDK